MALCEQTQFALVTISYAGRMITNSRDTCDLVQNLTSTLCTHHNNFVKTVCFENKNPSVSQPQKERFQEQVKIIFFPAKKWAILKYFKNYLKTQILFGLLLQGAKVSPYY